MSVTTLKQSGRFICVALVILGQSLFIGCTDLELASDDGQSTEMGDDSILKGDQNCGAAPSYYLRYLDDTECKKMVPSNRNREFQCPANATTSLIESESNYAPFDPRQVVTVDQDALTPFVPSNMSVTMILIRRVNGVPHYRYLSNGTHNKIVETWSSSKFIGIMNASESLRYSSGGMIGLDATVDDYPVGDLATVVHNYDETHFTSNGLMAWFHDVGGHYFANDLMHDRWLNRPEEEVYGANYGAPPASLGFTFKRGEEQVDIRPDEGWIKSNLLSTFTLAEALKRLVMYREDPEGKLEYSTWNDVQTLLYGASESQWYDANTPQGMESDTAVYLQEAVDIKSLDRETQGSWRVYSKLGLGFSRGGEIVHTGYACFPSLDDSGQPVSDQGVEFVISVHLPANDNQAEADAILASTYKKIVDAVQSGTLK